MPLVDLREEAVVERVRRACQDIGFFVVVGHGVDPALVRRMDDLSRAFFDLPREEKLELAGGDLVADRPIYRPIRSESLGATSGEVRSGDLKESLDYGPTLPGVAWPSRPPELERTYREYLAAMNALGTTLRQAIAIALGHEETFFEPLFDDRGSSIRVINYPALDASPHGGELRAGAHSDYGFLTILRSENVPGGLEVQLPDGRWFAAETPAGGFVVNLGDMLSEWTDGRWVSTLHRVGVPPPGTAAPRRQSLVFFHNPRGDAYLEGLGTTSDEYIRAKAAAAFGT